MRYKRLKSNTLIDVKSTPTKIDYAEQFLQSLTSGGAIQAKDTQIKSLELKDEDGEGSQSKVKKDDEDGGWADFAEPAITSSRTAERKEDDLSSQIKSVQKSHELDIIALREKYHRETY